MRQMRRFFAVTSQLTRLQDRMTSLEGRLNTIENLLRSPDDVGAGSALNGSPLPVN